jgi:hypothetical protein
MEGQRKAQVDVKKKVKTNSSRPFAGQRLSQNGQSEMALSSVAVSGGGRRRWSEYFHSFSFCAGHGMRFV